MSKIFLHFFILLVLLSCSPTPEISDIWDGTYQSLFGGDYTAVVNKEGGFVLVQSGSSIDSLRLGPRTILDLGRDPTVLWGETEEATYKLEPDSLTLKIQGMRIYSPSIASGSPSTVQISGTRIDSVGDSTKCSFQFWNPNYKQEQ